MTKGPIRYLSVLISLLVLSICSAHAQRRMDGKSGDRSATSTALSLNTTTAYTDSNDGLPQKQTKPESLTFKPVPGDPKTRMAEFRTPRGLRLRAYASGPNSVRLAAADQSLEFGEIRIDGTNVVEKMTSVGSVVDAIVGALNGIGEALDNFLPGPRMPKKCSKTTTITITDGDVKTTHSIHCTYQ